jgi:hypothetical protein
MAITLTELISRGKQLADMENGNFVSDDEWTHFINEEIDDIYAQFVNVDDGELFGAVAPTLAQIGDNAYQLPSDFLRLVDVNIYTGSRWVPCFEADPQEYYQLLSDTYTGDYDTSYFLKLNIPQDRYELFIFPAKSVANIGVRYIPAATTLSLGSDTLNWPSNWHQAVEAGAAARALIKEESDPTGNLMARDKTVARALKDIRSQKVSQVKTLRNLGSRRSGLRRWRLPRIN